MNTKERHNRMILESINGCPMVHACTSYFSDNKHLQASVMLPFEAIVITSTACTIIKY